MGDEGGNPGEGFDYRVALEKRHERNVHRRVFREMIRNELDDAPLGWLKRRNLIRFAVRLGIDEFEARLIVRAVEYECGRASPAAMTEVESQVQADFISQSNESGESWMTHIVAVGVIAAIALGFAYLRSGI